MFTHEADQTEDERNSIITNFLMAAWLQFENQEDYQPDFLNNLLPLNAQNGQTSSKAPDQATSDFMNMEFTR